MAFSRVGDLYGVSLMTDGFVFPFRYGGAYQLGSSALQPLTGKLFTYFSTKVGKAMASLLYLLSVS